VQIRYFHTTFHTRFFEIVTLEVKKSRKFYFTDAAIQWLPLSSAPVLQKPPSQEKPVGGLLDKGASPPLATAEQISLMELSEAVAILPFLYFMEYPALGRAVSFPILGVCVKLFNFQAGNSFAKSDFIGPG
jgi:hypothetical protein